MFTNCLTGRDFVKGQFAQLVTQRGGNRKFRNTGKGILETQNYKLKEMKGFENLKSRNSLHFIFNTHLSSYTLAQFVQKFLALYRMMKQFNVLIFQLPLPS
jgi:hypothetical protein